MGDALRNAFVNPAMLAGAAAIAAPIIIFLLNRYRYRTVDWAALVFLQRALKKQQRRLRLENLLLLIIRCLLLILFALALARPRSTGQVATNEEDVSRNVVLLVDTSYSTRYQVGSDQEETVYERAKRAAKDVVAGLADGDRVAVVAFDESYRPLYPTPRQLSNRVREEILADLDDAPEMQGSERGTDLGEALHELPRLLRSFDFDSAGNPPPEGAPPLKKSIFLLTDAQRSGLLDAEGNLLDRNLAPKAKELRELGGSLVLLDCGVEEPKNVSVLRLGTLEPVVGRGLPCHVECTVKNWSAVEIKDLTVEYFVDGAESPQKTVSLDIPAGEERTPDPLRYVFNTAELHRVEVRVKSDALQLDNRRHFVADVREHVRVLLVDGEDSRERWEGETDFIEEVLELSDHPSEDGPGLIQPDAIDEARLPGRDFEDYDIVFLANVSSLSDEQTASLERFARGGGAVVFTMGKQVDRDAYNQGLWREGRGIFPVELGQVRGGTRAEAQIDEDAPEWVMSLGDFQGHPVELFDEEEMTPWLRLPSLFGFVSAVPPSPELREEQAPLWIPLRVAPRPATDALGGAPDDETPGQPLLIEQAFGRGRVVVWLSSVDYAWNNCVLYDGFYLPFWRHLILSLAQRTRPALNLDIGGRYERLLRAEEYAARIEVETPDGRREAVVLSREGEQELYRLVYPDGDERRGLQESGLYTLTRSGVASGEDTVPPDHFAVTLDPSEGDLAKFTADELEGALGVPVQPIRPEGAREALQTDGGVGGTQEFWRWVLAGVILLLVSESLLAAAFGRRRR